MWPAPRRASAGESISIPIPIRAADPQPTVGGNPPDPTPGPGASRWVPPGRTLRPAPRRAPRAVAS